jgi:hypothetical protein
LQLRRSEDWRNVEAIMQILNRKRLLDNLQERLVDGSLLLLFAGALVLISAS